MFIPNRYIDYRYAHCLFLVWRYRLRSISSRNRYAHTNELVAMVFLIMNKLYRESTPKANFFSLMKKHKKHIPFNDYCIDRLKFDYIVTNKLRSYRLLEYQKRKVSFEVYLGASPRTIEKI